MTMKPSNCKPRSAWRTWQKIGAQWANRFTNATGQDIADAAKKFAEESPLAVAHHARRRAFAEGAHNPHTLK